MINFLSYFLTSQRYCDINLNIMAVSSERLARRPSSREANHRIGEFNLHLLLKKHASEKCGTWKSFDVLNGNIAAQTGAYIPQILSQQLDFSSLGWAGLNTSNLMCKLFIGESLKNGPITADLSDASATIEISKKITDVDLLRPKFTPTLIRIAGVSREHEKIIVVTFDAERNQLTRVNISAPEVKKKTKR